MLNKGASSCVMEVSSHALYLKRVEYSDFKVGIFSNLSRDHLDFHKDFDDYFDAKARLFNMSQVGVVNIDNSYGEKLAKIAMCKILTVSMEKDADIRAINVIKHKDSVEFEVISSSYNGKIFINIPGLFTVYNALCAIGAAMALEIPFERVQSGLKEVIVPGRAEIVQANDNYTVMVDYAHTPDSLENILSSVKQFAKGRVVSVFGCGGDRDKTKRPIMGEISGKIADYTVITSDNPRTEVPMQIIKEIEEGIIKTGSDYKIIEDRRAAIKYAILNAKKDDVIVIAGKGHETYQDFGDKKIDFDERKVVREILNEIGTQ
jgi:UDP-N-acetylmuramoyl-L-alanyl-D-glutamate--2,6-diaminopimelate ligase